MRILSLSSRAVCVAEMLISRMSSSSAQFFGSLPEMAVKKTRTGTSTTTVDSCQPGLDQAFRGDDDEGHRGKQADADHGHECSDDTGEA
ncbi:hypothetical protein [Streptomyces yanii]|uniref:Secreted protein n=1 Tax=Streptomyces yanii TaxID=78510 RepID=A0ABV5RNK2_9ACTN